MPGLAAVQMGTILLELRRSHFVALARQAGNVRTQQIDLAQLLA